MEPRLRFAERSAEGGLKLGRGSGVGEAGQGFVELFQERFARGVQHGGVAAAGERECGQDGVAGDEQSDGGDLEQSAGSLVERAGEFFDAFCEVGAAAGREASAQPFPDFLASLIELRTGTKVEAAEVGGEAFSGGKSVHGDATAGDRSGFAHQLDAVQHPGEGRVEAGG